MHFQNQNKIKYISNICAKFSENNKMENNINPINFEYIL